MKNQFTEKQLKDLIHKLEVNPSENWKERTRIHLKNLVQEENVTDTTPVRIHSRNLFPNLLTMKKALSFLVAIALVVGVGYSFYNYNQATNRFDRHFSKAKTALEQLEAYTQGTNLTLDQAFNLLPVAYAEGEVSEEEQVVEDLVETVSEETDAAIEAAEDIEEIEATTDAFVAVDELQDKTVEVLSDVIETVESEEVAEVVSDVIEDTVEENAEVEEAVETLEEAAASGEEEVTVEVETDTDEEGEEEEESSTKEEKISERLEIAEQLVSELDLESVELTPSMQKKFDAINEILATCASGEGKCNSGKAKGLATALDAKVRNELRKQAKDADDEDGGEGEDEDDEGEEEGDDDEGEEADENDDEVAENEDTDEEVAAENDETEDLEAEEEEVKAPGSQKENKKGKNLKDEDDDEEEDEDESEESEE